MNELSNALAKQAVALNDPDINLGKLMNSEYLFSSVGTVRDFIELKESVLNSKINVLDLIYVKIK